MHDVQLRSDITNRVVLEVTLVRPFPSLVLVCINDDFWNWSYWALILSIFEVVVSSYRNLPAAFRVFRFLKTVPYYQMLCKIQRQFAAIHNGELVIKTLINFVNIPRHQNIAELHRYHLEWWHDDRVPEKSEEMCWNFAENVLSQMENGRTRSRIKFCTGW